MVVELIKPRTKVIIRPQDGAQMNFVGSPADIVFYGGAAGGGKTVGGVFCPIPYLHLPITGLLLRRNMPEITLPGGMADECANWYSHLNGQFKGNSFDWIFPSKARLRLTHLQHAKDMFRHKGGQYNYLYFDELDSFAERVFWYLTTRMRSVAGVAPFVRAGFNPDPDSWIKKVIQWWLDPITGYPIPERSGVIRYFLRNSDDSLRWADDPFELIDWWAKNNPEEAKDPSKIPIPRSFTFIPATLDDNQILQAKDPLYRSNLMSQPYVERMQLLYGNWNVKHAAGLLFKREWCEMVDCLPANAKFCRGWDLAASEKTEMTDPDWTCGTLLARDKNNTIYVCDHKYIQGSPHKVRRLIKNTASQDPRRTIQAIPQDPAQSGKDQVLQLTKLLLGYKVHSSPEPGGSTSESAPPAKIKRFEGFSAQAEQGNVVIVRGDWNERFFRVLEGFPDGKIKDDADSTSRAFNTLVGTQSFNIHKVL